MKRKLLFAIAGLYGIALIGAAQAFPGEYSELCIFADELGLGSKEGLPEGLARFMGVYDGDWDGKLSHTLIVNRIKSDGTVMGFYATGTYKPWKITRPGCRGWHGKVDGDVLNLTLSNGAVVSYRFSGMEALAGVYV